jgi:pyroglutamyl-peptidase
MAKAGVSGGGRDVLLTGFAPFAGERVNPSWEAVRRLAGARVHGREIAAVRLPTSFEGGVGKLRTALRRRRPGLVLCVGQAGGRSAISLERVALNLIDARIPDNAGAQPIDQPVVAGAPAAYFATLPLKSMWQALQAAGIPCELSQSAGSYVCNAVFYALMHELAQEQRVVPAGFMHVPYLPAQVSRRPQLPSMTLETIVRALELGVRAALRPAPGKPGSPASAGREA